MELERCIKLAQLEDIAMDVHSFLKAALYEKDPENVRAAIIECILMLEYALPELKGSTENQLLLFKQLIK